MFMDTIDMTPQEYAKRRRVTPQSVQHAITKFLDRGNAALPGVTEVKRFGRFYVLVVDTKKIRKGRLTKYSK